MAEADDIIAAHKASEQAMPLREKLADLCHEQWSGWMKYLFGKCKHVRLEHDATVYSGDVIIPKEFAGRWYRQMKTTYADLSEHERNSDREEADRFLAIMNQENK